MNVETFRDGLTEICQKAYDEHEQACAVIKRENAALLREFVDWMRQQGLGEKTLSMHFSNVAFYIQEFLLYEQPLRPQDGASRIGMYLGSWFIRKGPIATPGTVKTTATSLVKFYSFLVTKGLVPPEQLDRMRATIKSEKALWQERARRYNDPTIHDVGRIWV